MDPENSEIWGLLAVAYASESIVNYKYSII